MGFVIVSFEWGGEYCSLKVDEETWRKITAGEETFLFSEAGYDGETFDMTWNFNFQKKGRLTVDYGIDGGCALDGEIKDLEISSG